LSPAPLDRLLREGSLKDIPGIGDALTSIVISIYQTGQHSGLEAMRAKTPEGVLAMSIARPSIWSMRPTAWILQSTTQN
jgi:hypothetical protein